MSIDKQIYNKVIKRGFTAALGNLIAAQARFESADYTSNVFKNNTNLFGYKYVGQPGATKGTLAPKGEWNSPNIPQYYAKYNSVEDSTNEIINWLLRRQQEGKFLIADLNTPGKYAAALKAGNYYGTSAANYSNGLTAKLKKVDLIGDSSSNLASALPVVLLLGIAIASLKR